MSIDPDFIITVNGEQVTKYVWEWKLTDSEKKSILEVSMRNPDQKLSSKFDTGQKVEIIFGYVGNMGEKIAMEIVKMEESYCVEGEHDYIKVIGQDDLSTKTEGDNHKSGGDGDSDDTGQP
jgi:uncharacterized protein with GYD domain